jgi:hypothetical protein
MIGRVDSVRCQVQVDQTTGARTTLFYIVGRDWGQIFESTFYMDILASWSGDNSLGSVIKLGFNSKLIEAVDKGTNLPSTSQWVDFFIKLWGQSNTDIGKSIRGTLVKEAGALDPNRVLPQSAFVLPKTLAEPLGFTGNANLSNSLVVVDDGRVESVGFPELSSLTGGHPLWSILHNVSNTIINELVVDLTWDKPVDGTPQFTLYKRIKPFYLNQKLTSAGSKVRTGPHTENIKSSFLKLPRVDLNTDTIIGIDYGTNWLDRINFIELIGNSSPVSQHLGQTGASIAKMTEGVAVYDPKAYAREGIKPMLMSSIFLPPASKEKSLDFKAIVEWVPVVATWYFDTHKMLNGTISMMGHDEYIGVGANISFETSLMSSRTSKGQDVLMDEGGGITPSDSTTKIVAHVENVNYRFSVGQDGAKTMATTVAFVRGVTTTPDCSSLVNPDEFGIDSFASRMSIADEDFQNVTQLKD